MRTELHGARVRNGAGHCSSNLSPALISSDLLTERKKLDLISKETHSCSFCKNKSCTSYTICNELLASISESTTTLA